MKGTDRGREGERERGRKDRNTCSSIRQGTNQMLGHQCLSHLYMLCIQCMYMSIKNSLTHCDPPPEMCLSL